ncbi:zinc finger protein 239 isoform X1 [Phlebotomus argentipes]|uniref:zinc finger protein 239 isoform X1 n=1 Tax=Phlebotomus argentipes TaxID=94469 RepID=UPI002892EE3A|nr:zinc finger protein 239 isoform X1 [Phlebotomus argentipes]
MPSFCVIPSCVDKYSHSADISFHKFPHKDGVLLQKWTEFVVQERGSDWKPSRWSSICSRHFALEDFRQHCGRRCLKSRAIPCQLMPREEKDESEEKDSEREFCHLCGGELVQRSCLKSEKSVSEWIQKCFPTISFDSLEISPCEDCFSRLRSFAAFVDVVTRCQTEKLRIPEDKMAQEKQGKPVKIKQEVTVKEEINAQPIIAIREVPFELPPEYSPSQSSEKISCEHYIDEILNYNPSDEVENCEIMEISDLEKVFIDIAEETSDTELKIPPKNRIEIISSISVKTELKPESWMTDFSAISLPSDHTYAKSPLQICKMEKLEVNPGEKLPNSTPRINIINNLLLRDCKVSTCSACGKIYQNMREFLVHKMKCQKRSGLRNPRRVKCRDCGQDFPTKLTHNHHQRFLCERRKGVSFPCSKCSLEFPKLLEMRKHAILFHPGRYDRRKSQRLHRRREDGRYSCEFCGRTYTRASNLLRHERLHRSREEWDLKCRQCGHLFDKPHDLNRHMKTSPACQNFRNCASTETLFRFMCSVCGRQFSSPNGLKHHESSHQMRTLKPCICETCGKSFPRASLLWQHKISHTDAQNYHCKLCPKVFKRSNGLQQHIRGYHLKLKPHRCGVCHRGYALKADMKRCRHSWLKAE